MSEVADTGKRRRSRSRFFRLLSTPRRLAARGGQNASPVSARLSTWVGIVSACIGGFLGLDTYRADVAKQVDERVAESFAMIDRFNAEGLAGPRARTLSYVEAKRFCDARIISREFTDADVIAVLDFFDFANACVGAGLCDETTAARFFSPYANYQWPVLEKIVAEYKTNEQSLRADIGFGDGMQQFATAPRELPPCDGNF